MSYSDRKTSTQVVENAAAVCPWPEMQWLGGSKQLLETLKDQLGDEALKNPRATGCFFIKKSSVRPKDHPTFTIPEGFVEGKMKFASGDEEEGYIAQIANISFIIPCVLWKIVKKQESGGRPEIVRWLAHNEYVKTDELLPGQALQSDTKWLTHVKGCEQVIRFTAPGLERSGPLKELLKQHRECVLDPINEKRAQDDKLAPFAFFVPITSAAKLQGPAGFGAAKVAPMVWARPAEITTKYLEAKDVGDALYGSFEYEYLANQQWSRGVRTDQAQQSSTAPNGTSDPVGDDIPF